MESVSLKQIREALAYGNKNGYTLFPEIRMRENIQKAKENPTLLNNIEQIFSYANSVKDQPSVVLSYSVFKEFAENGNRNNYQKLYFDNKMQLHVLIMAEIIEDCGAYMQTIEQRLWEWCNTYTWELPAHVPLNPKDIEAKKFGPEQTVALFSAETAFYFAEIYSLLEHKLSPLLAYRLKNEMFRRCINPYLNEAYWWDGSDMNWASVCAGSIGCAAMYLMDNTHELSVIINRVIATMNSYLHGFDKDGVTTEGMGYWAYGFNFFVCFSEMLRERTCGKIDLLKMDKKMEKIAMQPMYLQFPDNSVVNFSDSVHIWKGANGLLSRLSKVFDIKEYKYPTKIDIFDDHTSKWVLLSRDIFWALDTDNVKPSEIKTGMFYFSQSQWLIDRRITPNNKFMCFAAKGGHNDEPHNHNDLGHFIIHFDTQTIFMDFGAPEYTSKSFKEERYTILQNNSAGHSVPVINGHLQSEGGEFFASVFECSEKDNVVKYGLDLKNAYNIKQLSDFKREFNWDYANMELLISDEFIFDGGNNIVEEVFYTPIQPVIKNDGMILIESKDNTTYLEFDSNSVCEVIKIETQNHFKEDITVYKIGIKYNTKNELKVNIKIRINN